MDESENKFGKKLTLWKVAVQKVSIIVVLTVVNDFKMLTLKMHCYIKHPSYQYAVDDDRLQNRY